MRVLLPWIWRAIKHPLRPPQETEDAFNSLQETLRRSRLCSRAFERVVRKQLEQADDTGRTDDSGSAVGDSAVGADKPSRLGMVHS